MADTTKIKYLIEFVKGFLKSEGYIIDGQSGDESSESGTILRFTSKEIDSKLHKKAIKWPKSTSGREFLFEIWIRDSNLETSTEGGINLKEVIAKETAPIQVKENIYISLFGSPFPNTKGYIHRNKINLITKEEIKDLSLSEIHNLFNQRVKENNITKRIQDCYNNLVNTNY